MSARNAPDGAFRIRRIMLILKILNTTPQIFIHLNLVDDP